MNEIDLNDISEFLLFGKDAGLIIFGAAVSAIVYKIKTTSRLVNAINDLKYLMNELDIKIEKNIDFYKNYIPIENVKEEIINNFKDFSESWQSYYKNMIIIISIIESNEMILKGIKGYYTILFNEVPNLLNIIKNISDIYYRFIFPYIGNNTQIDDKYINSVSNFYISFKGKCINIDSIISDLEIELQNKSIKNQTFMSS
jgi:hypothetical protein